MYKIPAKTLFTGQKLIYVPECHSTNSSLAGLLEGAELPEGAVLITDHQTEGRGQRGNRWESGQGENLTFSILFRPKFLSARDQFQLNMAVSLGVISGLSHFVSNGLSVKWPNDILVGEKKLGGILIENQTQGSQMTAAIVGIGLNVNQRVMAFPSAVSLIQVTGQVFDLNEVLQAILTDVESRYLQLRSASHRLISTEYHRMLFKVGLPHLFEAEGAQFTGVITGVDDSGMLGIRIGNEVKRFSLKEVKMIL